MFYTYILYSSLKERFYIGQTNNITNRLLKHNNGSVKSTKTEIPWQLIHKEEFTNRADAMQKENQIKIPDTKASR